MERSEVVEAMRSLRPVAGADIRIRCASVRANPFQDILDLYLALSRVKRWEWEDVQGAVAGRPWAGTAVGHVMRDLMLWPVLYCSSRCEIERLSRQTVQVQHRPEKGGALYLRSDHWFSVASGGSVGHTSGVVHGLRALGYRTDVVSTDRLAGVENDDCFHLCAPDYRIGRNLPQVPELRYSGRLRDYVAAQWKEFDPAFLYQRYSLANYSGVALRAAFRVPLVLEYNGSFLWVARHWEGGRIFHERLVERIELLNLRKADVVVVVSRALCDELAGAGIPREKILVNPNGVDPVAYAPDVNGEPVRRRYGLTGKTVIGFIGTFGRWHGAEVLADAFGRLLRAFPGCRESVALLMVGDGPTMPQVRAALDDACSGAGICVLTGRVPQEEGPAHLAACDILVSPHVPNPDGTPFFGSPTKLFEYMAMGKGIVASDLDQIGEILTHGKTAWLVKPGDAESLMFGIKALIDETGLRERLGEAARDEAVANHTWTEHTKKIVERLRERMARRNQARQGAEVHP